MGYPFLGRQPLAARKFNLFLMAYFHYLSEVTNDCLLTSFQDLLEEAGLIVSEEFSNHSQVFAEEKPTGNKYNSLVKVLISWSDKNNKQCSIEVRSDEPYLKSDTQCEKVKSTLHKLIPPKTVTSNSPDWRHQ